MTQTVAQQLAEASGMAKGDVEYARKGIETTARETKSHAARMAIAKLASGPLANLTDEAKALWADYHADGAPDAKGKRS